MKAPILLAFLFITHFSFSQTSFSNLNFLTGNTATGEVLNTSGTVLLSGNTPNQFNAINDATAAKLAADNGDIKDFTLSGNSFAGALGNTSVTLNPAGAPARIRNDQGYTGAPAGNNPGSASGNTFTLRFNSNLNVTDAVFNLNSLNTAGTAWEYTVIQLLDPSGNPFNPITSPGWTLGAPSQYNTGPVAGFSGQAGIGNYIAASKATVTGVGGNTSSGANGTNDNLGTFSYATAGLPAGTPIGGIRFTTYLEDVRGTGNVNTSFTSSLLDFTILGSVLTVVPVSLISFSGYRSGVANQLSWVTAFEQNNKGFEVQRSADGLRFEPIDFVSTKAIGGNSNNNIAYSYTDNNPSGAKQYYRLYQKDADNRGRLSNVIIIRGEKPLRISMTGLFPNPAGNFINLTFALPAADDLSLSIIDISGKVLMQHTCAAGTGANTILLDVSSLHKGNYIIRLTFNKDEEDYKERFIKL